MAGLNALFVALPEIRLQQVGMVAHEHGTHRVIAQQKRGEGFGEHVFRPDGIPDLAAHLIFFVARCGHLSELAVGDVFDLVVVIKNHLAMACDAKIFPQHVTREDIGRHQILDGVTVLNHRALDLRLPSRFLHADIKRFLQVNVQRDHPPLDVDMFDDDLGVAITVAVRNLQLAWRKLFNLGNQRVVKTRPRKSHFAVLLRVGHTAHTVVLLDQQILAFDDLARGVFLRRVIVLDDLEHIGKRGQVKHQHHHALDAGRDAKFVGAVPQMVQKIAVKKCFPLLGQAQRVVDFSPRHARHHAAQKHHIGRRNTHVNHEVGPCKAEQNQQVVFAEQRCINDKFSTFGVQQRQRKRHFLEAVDQLADHIRALVAKKQARQHLNLKIGAQLGVTQQLAQHLHHIAHVPGQVFKFNVQREVLHQLLHHLGHRALRRVVGAVSWQGGGFFVFDVLGADSRPHKDEIVLKVAAVQDFGGDRVEKRLGQLGLVVVDQQPDVVQLDLMPQLHRLLARLELALQPRRRFTHPQIVKLDALALGALLAVPICGLKPVFGPG